MKSVLSAAWPDHLGAIVACARKDQLVSPTEIRHLRRRSTIDRMIDKEEFVRKKHQETTVAADVKFREPHFSTHNSTHKMGCLT